MKYATIAAALIYALFFGSQIVKSVIANAPTALEQSAEPSADDRWLLIKWEEEKAQWDGTMTDRQTCAEALEDFLPRTPYEKAFCLTPSTGGVFSHG